MEISLDLVTEAARRRLAAVTPEVAGYIVLLAARELEARLFRVSAANLALSETGEVRAHPQGWMSEREVEVALRELLASLLSLSPSPSPAVVAVAERAENTGLRSLTAELTAALIPINHAAAQRALARLFRETRRARDAVGDELGIPRAAALDAAAGQAGPPSAPLHGAAPDQLLPDASGPPPRAVPAAADELDIDVEIDDGPANASPLAAAPSDAPAAAPRAPAAIAPPPSDELARPAPDPDRASDDDGTIQRAAAPVESRAPLPGDVVAVRSDVDTLLAAFLGHTRQESSLTLALRRLVGITDAGAGEAQGAASGTALAAARVG